MRKLIFLFILMLTVGVATKAADVTFKASAPQAVVMGEQFRLTFTVNAEGKDLRVQEMPDFDVLMGPSQSTSYSSSWVNGKSTSETTVTYTYVLMPKKEGTFIHRMAWPSRCFRLIRRVSKRRRQRRRAGRSLTIGCS